MAFSLTPGQAIDDVLDFTQKSHRAIYNSAIAPLPIDKFDCVQNQLVDFMSALSKRAHDIGWVERIMKIPRTLPEDANTEYWNLLTNHGQIPIESIRNYELSYVTDQTRNRQDMQCLYTCVMDSLSQEGRAKVLTEEEKYQIPADPTDEEDDEVAYSGNLLLKVVLAKSSVDNRSGSFSIRMKLSSLDALIEKLGHDIEKFNMRVREYIEELNRRGETSDDVTFNLFKAYRQVPIKEFVNFINRVKDENDGLEDEDQHTPQYIMDKAENKFKILVSEGAWDSKMKENDELMAIKAKLKELKKRRANPKGRGSGANKGKKGGKPKVDIGRKPANIHKPVKIDGKMWYWCSPETGGKCSGVLRRHKPEECKGIAKAKDNDSTSTGSRKRQGSSDDSKKRVKLKANETTITSGEEKDGNESDLSQENFDIEENE